MTRQAVSHAASLTPNIEFSAEDASRSDRDFLAQIVETAIACGATTINIPDTVGYAQPREFGELIAWLITNVRGSEQVVFSVWTRAPFFVPNAAAKVRILLFVAVNLIDKLL